MSQVCKISSLRDLARIQNWHAGLKGEISSTIIVVITCEVQFFYITDKKGAL